MSIELIIIMLIFFVCILIAVLWYIIKIQGDILENQIFILKTFKSIYKLYELKTD